MVKRMEALALSVFVWAACLSLPLLGARGSKAEAKEQAGATVRITFLNVGKADAALLCLGDLRYLVDTGAKESADALLRALAYEKVERLDGVFITHTDKDHVGGLKALLKSGIVVAQLYAPYYHNESSNEKHPAVKLAEKYTVPFAWLRAGDSIEPLKGMRLLVLGPLRQDTANENNNSLVLRVITPQGDLLLTGDMETPEEAELLAAGLVQPAAVLKVGHHGEGDASSASFLYTVKPQIAVISTDSAAESDTPDPGVMSRLWNIGAEVLLTQKATCGVQVTLTDGNAVGQLIQYTVQ